MTATESKAGWFELIVGKSVPTDGGAKCFGFVTSYDTKPKRRLSVLLVLVIVQQQHIPSVRYGLIVAAGGVGNLLGAALCPLLQRRIRFGRALGCALIVFVLLWPLYGFITTPLLLGAVFAGIALSDSIRAIFMDSYRFAVVPDALQSRVSGIYRVILFSVPP